MNSDEKEFWGKMLANAKFVPGSGTGDADGHLCPLERQTAEDRVSNCSVCNRPVYFLCDWPHLAKICPQCAAKDKDIERHIINEEALIKFIMSDKRN